jgi:hypothetical protein
MTSDTTDKHRTPLWLLLFCYALMGPAVGINFAFIALAIPALASFGITGLIGAGLVGAVVGILPAIWLARQIHAGIREDH